MILKQEQAFFTLVISVVAADCSSTLLRPWYAFCVHVDSGCRRTGQEIHTWGCVYSLCMNTDSVPVIVDRESPGHHKTWPMLTAVYGHPQAWVVTKFYLFIYLILIIWPLLVGTLPHIARAMISRSLGWKWPHWPGLKNVAKQDYRAQKSKCFHCNKWHRAKPLSNLWPDHKCALCLTMTKDGQQPQQWNDKQCRAT